MAVTKPTHTQTLRKSSRMQSTLVELSLRFSSLERPSIKSISIFKEQFYTLILNADAKERQKIASIFSKNLYVPKAIILFFSMQEIAIAASPLAHSPLLRSYELNELIHKCPIEHARVIARREDLDMSNIETLLNADDNSGSVKFILSTNTAILENDQIHEFVNSYTNTKWQEIPAENITTIELPSQAKVQTHVKDLSSSLVSLANKGGKLLRKPQGKNATQHVSSITKKQIEKQLLVSARLLDMEKFSKTIKDCCGLNSEITLHFTKNNDAGMLASLLCALEIPDISAARILLLTNQNIGRNGEIFRIVMNKYKNLNQVECISYFEKLGAQFQKPVTNNLEDTKNTRFALSLAARDRRAALLQKQKLEKVPHNEDKLRA